jgi:hypothetical protein
MVDKLRKNATEHVIELGSSGDREGSLCQSATAYDRNLGHNISFTVLSQQTQRGILLSLYFIEVAGIWT